MTYSAVVLHDRFELSDQGDAVLYGRVAAAADCATLRLPAAERALCPTPRIVASYGVDGLVNDPYSPAYTAPHPADVSRAEIVKRFSYAVLGQQPLQVAGAIADDAVKLFALTRDTAPGDTPISRWQFQTTYPTYSDTITVSTASALFSSNGGGGAPTAVRPLAVFLRDYQLHGGYTPGPFLLLSLLLGLAGTALGRRRGNLPAVLACLLVTVTGVAVLLGADMYEFSWRYQLPALVTLPAAGALGVTVIQAQVRQAPRPEAERSERARSGSNVGQVPSEPEQPDVRSLDSRVVYEDHWIRLRQDQIERRDGSRGTYAVVEKPDFALIIPAENGGFHLVEEYRYPIQRRTWSFPQGNFPGRADGDPAELARLELSQETGFRARELTRIGFFHCSHGTSNQGCYVFLATGLEAGAPDREPEEQDMRQQWVPRARFEGMVRAGAITDDSSLAAYTLLVLHEKRSG